MDETKKTPRELSREDRENEETEGIRDAQGQLWVRSTEPGFKWVKVNG